MTAGPNAMDKGLKEAMLMELRQFMPISAAYSQFLQRTGQL
jgi:hypothetical protein